MSSKQKVKILFFGNERLATGVTTQAPVLQALLSAGYEIEAVIANHIDSVSRVSRDLEIGQLAHEHGIPVILPGNKIPLAEKVAKHRTVLAVLAAFGQIVPQTVIDMFPLGIINIHPSLLPLLRGSTPIESTILNGSTATGVSIMKLVREMDAGPVYSQVELKLRDNESKQDLADQLGQIGAKQLVKVLPAIIDESLKPKPQVGQPTFSKRIQKTDGKLDANKSAAQLEREIRAYAQWPKSYIDQNKQRFIITKATVSSIESNLGQLSAKDKSLYFGCKDGSLEILELQPAGKKLMDAASFINGYRQLLS